GVRKKLEFSLEVQLAVLERLLERVAEFAAKDSAQDFLGEEGFVSGATPSGVVGGEAAGGNDDMGRRRELELLIPGVHPNEEADLRAEKSRIAGHFKQGLGTGAEQQIVEDL